MNPMKRKFGDVNFQYEATPVYRCNATIGQENNDNENELQKLQTKCLELGNINGPFI